MKLTNDEIYTNAQALVENFSNKDQYLPVVINFVIQKNKSILIPLAEQIEQLRIEIAEKFGDLDKSDSQYVVPPERIEEATKELDALYAIEQDVPLQTIAFSKLLEQNPSLTVGQMEALVFMINEKE